MLHPLCHCRAWSRAAGLLCAVLWALGAPVCAENLTWGECVKEATLNNPGLAAAQQEIQRTEAVRKGAYSTFLPQVNATSGMSRSHNERNVTISGFGVEGTPSSGGGSYYTDSYTLQIQAQQQLFDGFFTKGQVDKARAEISVAVAKLLTQKALVSFELKSAFAQMLYAQELIDIAGEILERRELNARMVELKYDNGRENKGALLLSRANVTQAKTDLQQARRTLELSGIQLATVMGRTKFGPMAAKGLLKTAEPAKEPDYVALAVKTPAHFQQEAAVAAAKAGITVAASDFYPQIYAYGNISSQSGEGYATPKSWEIGLSGTWALFDGAATYFNVRAARANLESQRSSLRLTLVDTARSLAEDHRSLLDAIENVDVSAAFLEATALRARIAEEQYRNGLVSFQDFDVITNDHINRQKSHLMARRDAVLAEARWEESQGIGAIP